MVVISFTPGICTFKQLKMFYFVNGPYNWDVFQKYPAMIDSMRWRDKETE